MLPKARPSKFVSAPFDFGSVRVRLPLVSSRQRIGLLGGSFNPAHQGHLLISRFALARLRLDCVWWLVSPGNPLKSHAGLGTQALRMAAARVVASADRRIVVTGFEAGLPSAFTASTIDFLQRRHPSTRFVWLMGADCLQAFHSWHQWQRIFESIPVAVIDRPGWRLRGMSSKAAIRYRRAFVPPARAVLVPGLPPPAWTFLTAPLSHLSSTALRAAGQPED